jgi:hypothetical protein
MAQAMRHLLFWALLAARPVWGGALREPLYTQPPGDGRTAPASKNHKENP